MSIPLNEYIKNVGWFWAAINFIYLFIIIHKSNYLIYFIISFICAAVITLYAGNISRDILKEINKNKQKNIYSLVSKQLRARGISNYNLDLFKKRLKVTVTLFIIGLILFSFYILSICILIKLAESKIMLEYTISLILASLVFIIYTIRDFALIDVINTKFKNK